jgi:2-C-methyl-D-erythritol 4-phosphate cytidylyltransferase
MKSKKYFIQQLCKLRDLDPDGEEAKTMEEMKVVDLLIAIKKASPDNSVKVVPTSKTNNKVEYYEDFSAIAGCRF